MKNIDDEFEQLAPCLDLIAENRQLRYSLKIRTWMVVVSIGIYMIILSCIMRNHQHWYKKGKRDAYKEIKKMNERYGAKQ